MGNEIKEISVFHKFEAELVVFKEKYKNIVYDLDDDDEMKQAMADKYEISKVRGGIGRAHKSAKFEYKEICDALDSDKNRVMGVADTLYEGIDEQIKTHKQKAIDLEEDLNRKVIFISNIVENLVNKEEIGAAIAQLNELDIDSSYKHRENDAVATRVKSLQILEGQLALIEKQEAQEIKDEEIRIAEQKLRDEQIAKQAAAAAEEKAEAAKKAMIAAEKQTVIDKEKAEQEAIDKAKQVEEERLEVERQTEINRVAAVEKAKQGAIEAETKRLKDIELAKIEAKKQQDAAVEKAKQTEIKRVAEIKRIKDIEDAKNVKAKANQTHRAKIHTEAKISLMKINFYGDDREGIATEIIKAIINNEIEHLKIEY